MSKGEKFKAWYAANRERIIAKSTAWNAQNADRRRASMEAWKDDNKDRTRESARAYREANAAAVAKYASDYAKLNAAGNRARAALGKAVKLGKVKKYPCWVCGDPKVHGHHASYAPDAKLDVVWLCPKHHKQLHAEFSCSLA